MKRSISKQNFNKISFKRIESFPERPTIIFLHDSLGCIELWKDFPEKLGDLSKHNVLIYDRQGYGKSLPFSVKERGLDYLEVEADILFELMDLWKIDNAILFGHSDGGSIALIAAAKYPGRIKGIITEGAHIFVEDVTLRGIREAVGLYGSTNLKSKLEKYHGDKTEDMFNAWASTWTKKEFRNWSIENFMSQIVCPVLVIQGENDEFGTSAQVDGITKNVQGYSEKFIITNTKHTPHKENPQQVLEKSAEFINKKILK